MVDEKKIKEAARAYCDATYGALKEEPFIAESFSQGAQWAQKDFINSLWHDANEEPTKGKLILFETDTLSGLFYLIVWDKQDDWVIWSYKQHINKWLYVTDLFIKK